MPTAASRALVMIRVQSMSTPQSLADPLRAAEDALRPDEEDDDQDAQGADVLQLDRHPEGDERDEESDDDAADQGAVRRAQATEGDRGEDEQQDLKPHLEVHALRETEQDAGQAGERRSGDPDDPDDPVDVDAGRGRQ